ncbi:MAG: GntR family transcriptional regulator [Trueperaceae bacterium]|nr:GntR family transcriptional regulator [Trueperaceae bacterium]
MTESGGAPGDAVNTGAAWLIDKARPTPAYLQLHERMQHAIRRGELEAGRALPPERTLATTLGLSRMTVRRAVELLVEDGLVVRRQGSGTFVRRPSLEQTFDRVLGFTDEAHALGFTPGTTLLRARRARASAEAAARLGIPSGAHVLTVTRLRTADGEPLALQTATLAPAYADLSLPRLRRNESLYRTLREQFALAPHRARQSVSARLPTRTEQGRLALGPTDPVLALERITYDAAGHAFEFVRSAYRGDRYRLALDLAPPEAPS